MILTCPSCATRYLVDPAALGARGRAVRCARCAHTWQASPADAAATSPEPFAESDAPPPADREAPAAENEVFAAPPGPAPFGPDDGAPPPLPPGVRPATRNLPALREQRSIANLVGWTALVLLLVGVGVGLYFGRARIVAFWPPAARLYEVLSADVEPENKVGLELRNLSFSTSQDNGTPVLHVAGEVFNVTPQMRAVPPIRIALRNAAAEEIYQWTAEAEKTRIPPGSATRFSTSLDNPPAEARDMSVTFLADDLGESD